MPKVVAKLDYSKRSLRRLFKGHIRFAESAQINENYQEKINTISTHSTTTYHEADYVDMPLLDFREGTGLMERPHVETSNPLIDQELDKEPSENVTSYLDLPLNEFLRKLYTEYNLKRKPGSLLLKYLAHNVDSSLPADIRTLLQTPRHHNLIKMDPGDYLHIDIEYTLEKILSDSIENIIELNLEFFIDGMSFSKSSKRGIWIILGKVLDVLVDIAKKPFIVGIYIGYSKPKSFNEFLTPFVNNIKQISINLVINGRQVKATVKRILADSPARAAIAGKTMFP